MAESLRALGTMRGSAVKTPSTSVKISHSPALKALASATAVRSEPPRPSVVISWVIVIPWKPATMTTRPFATSSWMRLALMSMTLALVWRPSVMMPTCEPVKEIALSPSSSIAMASSAAETCSPVAMSMSSSRSGGLWLICRASSSSSSVVSPSAETTTTTSWPCRLVWTTRCATCLMRSGLATELPPNFWTMSDRAMRSRSSWKIIIIP